MAIPLNREMSDTVKQSMLMELSDRLMNNYRGVPNLRRWVSVCLRLKGLRTDTRYCFRPSCRDLVRAVSSCRDLEQLLGGFQRPSEMEQYSRFG